MKWRSAIAWGVAGLVLASNARADANTCAVSYEQAQTLRKQRVYTAAREQLALCQTACPKVLADDCRNWSDELATLQPTLRLRPTSSRDEPLASVRVTIDGKLVTDRISNGTVAVDPGEHQVEFAATGYLTQTIRVVLQDGEHDRTIAPVMVDDHTVVSVPAPARATHTTHVPAIVLGAAGGAALLAAGVLTVWGHVDRAHDLSTCAPNCPPGEPDSILSKWEIAGVVAAVGVVALACAATLFLAPSKSTTIGVGPGSLLLRARF